MAYKVVKHNGKRVDWPRDQRLLTRVEIDDYKSLPGCWTFKHAFRREKQIVVGSSCGVYRWNRKRRR